MGDRDSGRSSSDGMNEDWRAIEIGLAIRDSDPRVCKAGGRAAGKNKRANPRRVVRGFQVNSNLASLKDFLRSPVFVHRDIQFSFQTGSTEHVSKHANES
jgi:hypothetical protein